MHFIQIYVILCSEMHDSTVSRIYEIELSIRSDAFTLFNMANMSV